MRSASCAVQKRTLACKRPAAILVCVLVVLMLTGLMAVQGTRLLLAVARSATAHARAQQAQELLALGRMRLNQRLQRDDEYTGETLTVPITENGQDAAVVGEILIERLRSAESAEQGDGRWRIVASAPLNQPGQVTATWETKQ